MSYNDVWGRGPQMILCSALYTSSKTPDPPMGDDGAEWRLGTVPFRHFLLLEDDALCLLSLFFEVFLVSFPTKSDGPF